MQLATTASRLTSSGLHGILAANSYKGGLTSLPNCHNRAPYTLLSYPPQLLLLLRHGASLTWQGLWKEDPLRLFKFRENVRPLAGLRGLPFLRPRRNGAKSEQAGSKCKHTCLGEPVFRQCRELLQPADFMLLPWSCMNHWQISSIVADLGMLHKDQPRCCTSKGLCN